MARLAGKLQELELKIADERKKRGRAEHEYKEMKKMLAQEKSERFKVEVKLSEMKKHLTKIERKLRDAEMKSMTAVFESDG